MPKQRANGRRQPQRGYAMLATIAVIGVAATAAVTTTFGTTSAGSRQSTKTSTALAQAKQALISRAASDANHPGSLPCPDAVTNIAGNNVPNDGIADLLAGQSCPSSIGHLPWRTLGLPDLRDADGERLWYMLAPAYQDSPSKVINPGTSGQITAYECADDQPATQAWPCDHPRAVSATPWVAVVFAPGNHWRTTMTYSIDAGCAATDVTALCGAAVATLAAAAFPAGTTVVGGISNTLPPGTRAVLAFAGVAGGTAKTRIAFALQQ